jgi:GNAT superfamily N-acetyltransferase
MPGESSPFAEIRPLKDTAALYDLRGRVLRAGRPPEESRFAGDEADDTVHLGAFAGERCVGVVSLLRERPDQQERPVRPEMRLRGMAVEPEMQGRGVGAALLRHAQRLADAAGLDLWCNARASAVGFYERHGWVREGDPFDVPPIGLHYVMRRRREN